MFGHCIHLANFLGMRITATDVRKSSSDVIVHSPYEALDLFQPSFVLSSWADAQTLPTLPSSVQEFIYIGNEDVDLPKSSKHTLDLSHQVCLFDCPGRHHSKTIAFNFG